MNNYIYNQLYINVNLHKYKNDKIYTIKTSNWVQHTLPMETLLLGFW
jgi:hypothetical protein